MTGPSTPSSPAAPPGPSASSAPLEAPHGHTEASPSKKEGARAHPKPTPAPTGDLGTQALLAILGGFGLFALLAAAVMNAESLVHPVFPVAALVFFLYPFRQHILPRRLLQLGIVTFLTWFLLSLSGVLLPFIFALIIAYLFSPLMTRLASRGFPRWASALAIVLVILSIYALVGTFVVPGLIEQVDQLVQSARGMLEKSPAFLDKKRLVDTLASKGLPRKQVEDFIAHSVEPQLQGVLSWLFGNLTSLVQNVSSVLEGLMNLILIPILSFYLLVDFERLRGLARTVLCRDDEDVLELVGNVDGIVSSYLRGILLTSSLVGIMAVTILSVFSVPYAVVIGILTGVFNLVPTIGMLMNLGVAMIIYLFAPGSFVQNSLITLVMILGLHSLNSYLIEPRIIGERVGLHPVLLIASLFVFAHFLGMVGLLIAVPSTAILLMFLKEWYRRTFGPVPGFTDQPE